MQSTAPPAACIGFAARGARPPLTIPPCCRSIHVCPIAAKLLQRSNCMHCLWDSSCHILSVRPYAVFCRLLLPAAVLRCCCAASPSRVLASLWCPAQCSKVHSAAAYSFTTADYCRLLLRAAACCCLAG